MKIYYSSIVLQVYYQMIRNFIHFYENQIKRRLTEITFKQKLYSN